MRIITGLYLSSKVALTLCKLVAAMFGGKLFWGSVVDGQCCPYGSNDSKSSAMMLTLLPKSFCSNQSKILCSHFRLPK